MELGEVCVSEQRHSSSVTLIAKSLTDMSLLVFVYAVFCVLSPLAWAQVEQEQSLPDVPWNELMVNLPEAEMDAYAQEYLRQSAQDGALQRQNVPAASVQPAIRQLAPANDPPAPNRGPSKLTMNEVVLSRVDWLAELNQQADLALANNNWPLAELRLAQGVNEYADAHDLRLRLVGLLYGRGALDQTRALLQEGIALAPEYAQYRLILARLLAEQQRYEAALEQLNQLSPVMASNLDYYSLKAEVARRSGQCAQAVSTYQQLLAYGGTGAWWLGLGLCQRDLGQDFSHAFKQARASADLGVASQRFVEQQLEQQQLEQQQRRGQNGQTQTY